MLAALRLACLLALLLSIAWAIYKPAFDSFVAVAASLAAFVTSLLLKNQNKADPVQSQSVVNSSVGIQAGRDAKVENKRE